MALNREETSSLKFPPSRKESNTHLCLPGYLCRVQGERHKGWVLLCKVNRQLPILKGAERLVPGLGQVPC